MSPKKVEFLDVYITDYRLLSVNSLAVQWLGLRDFTAKGPGSIPGRGTKIPQAAWCGPKLKKKKSVL